MIGMTTRILISDPQIMYMEGIAALLVGRAQVVGIISNYSRVLPATSDLRPDIALIGGPHPSALKLCELLHLTLPEIGVILMGEGRGRAEDREIRKLGCAGYILKTSPASELYTAIEWATRRSNYLSPDAIEREASPSTLEQLNSMTKREREVLQLMALGKTSKEAGACLGVSAKTIEFHKHNVMLKTGLRGRADLVRFAIRVGVAQLE